ncbi:MAG: DUF2339 domain-containing protein [Akkermansiaceae bacterium]|nr:DUF2339 domain-containing protein [Akkermansiaceae bacterium]
MELIGVILFLLVLWLIIAPIIAIQKAAEARRRCERVEAQMAALQPQFERVIREVRRLKDSLPVPPAPETAAPPAPEPAPVAAETPPSATFETPPPLPARPAAEGGRSILEDGPQPTTLRTSLTPLVEEPVSQPAALEQPKPPLNLEQFMGVKLFAWLGGVALFFGIIFFVKYAFDNNLIPPAMRIAMGFVTGIGLMVGGLALHRRGTHTPLSHSLCATAVLVLYGVTFAAYERYGFFNQAGTFALMVLVTVTAFLIAVRLNALVVAGLGMVGGFLTPVLVSTGKDELLILSAYIALLVAGLIAVSRHRNWRFLVTAAVVGTVVLQAGWFDAHFSKGGYGEGLRVLWPMAVMVLFEILFVTATWLEKRRDGESPHPEGAAMAMVTVGWVFGFVLLGYEPVARQLPLIYAYILVQTTAVLVLAGLRPRLTPALVINALLGFLHLGLWTGAYLERGNLVPLLVIYLVFGAVNSVVPLVLARRAPTLGHATVPSQLWPWAAVVPLLLGLACIIQLPEPSLLVWVAVLLLNLLVVVLVPRAGSVLPVLGALLATLALAVAWLFSVPAASDSLAPFLGISLGFTALFGIAGRWLGKQVAARLPGESTSSNPEQLMTDALPVLAGVMPFGLLMLAIVQLPLAQPSPVFGVGLLMVFLLLGLGVLDRKSALAPTAFAGMFAVQVFWHLTGFQREAPTVPLLWSVGCYLLFLAFPFVFRRVLAGRVLPWITAAVSGVGYFLLVHNLVQQSYPQMSGRMGLVPCAFAIPSLLSLVAVVRMVGDMDPVKRSKLAWFGGVALFFITLVFPIQFDRQWITLGWALEGALLLWLFRRVAHPGLQLTGLGLLAVSFVRLALNPAVLAAYPRSATPILNWHLYTYGIAAAALFMGARWLTDPLPQLQPFKPKAVLYALCGILLFILLNLQIADFFTPRDAPTIDFGSGLNLARDMTYSIAWGLFALGLLVIGIWHQARPARYAAIGLLGITLLKLFLHDLSSLASVFRIGALIGVAVIAFIASFLYQQFFNRSNPS